MACSSKQASVRAAEEATPYEQEFDTEIEQEVVCGGSDFAQTKSNESVNLCMIRWGRVPFHLLLERITVEDDTHKDLILNVECNRGAHDPHWRCSFTITVLCSIGRSEEWQSAEQSMAASRSLNSLIVPILRISESDELATFATFKIKIKINSYSGHCPAMIRSFDHKTSITDATLIVEGKRLYVSRAILAMYSTYFHTLFYDNKFKDAANEEFNIADVSFDDMSLFLNIIYPNVTDDKPIKIDSSDSIEVLLLLSERFGADCVKRLMEKYLMEEFEDSIEGFTLARRLLISDRFRLSAPSSMIMNELKSERQLKKLGETEEYAELSESMRAAILDMRIRPSGGPRATRDSDNESTPTMTRRLSPEATSLCRRWYASRVNAHAIYPDINPPPAAVAASHRFVSRFDDPSSPRDQSYIHFQADIIRLQSAHSSFALSSALSTQLTQATTYLSMLLRPEYHQLSSAVRIPLHGVIVTLINSRDQSADNVGATVQRLVGLVDSLRRERPDREPNPNVRLARKRRADLP